MPNIEKEHSKTNCFLRLTGPAPLFCSFGCFLKEFSLYLEREVLLLMPEQSNLMAKNSWRKRK